MMQAILSVGAGLYQSFHRLLLFDSGVFNSWGGDNANFVNSSNPWFQRGGNWNNGTNAGVFNSNNNNGNNNYNNGFRVALSAVSQYARMPTRARLCKYLLVRRSVAARPDQHPCCRHILVLRPHKHNNR